MCNSNPSVLPFVASRTLEGASGNLSRLQSLDRVIPSDGQCPPSSHEEVTYLGKLQADLPLCYDNLFEEEILFIDILEKDYVHKALTLSYGAPVSHPFVDVMPTTHREVTNLTLISPPICSIVVSDGGVMIETSVSLSSTLAPDHTPSVVEPTPSSYRDILLRSRFRVYFDKVKSKGDILPITTLKCQNMAIRRKRDKAVTCKPNTPLFDIPGADPSHIPLFVRLDGISPSPLDIRDLRDMPLVEVTQ